MAKFLFIVIIIFGLSTCNKSKRISNDNPTYFHGKITYKYTYESDVLNIDSLSLARPHIGTMVFEDSNYKSSFFGKDTLNYIYVGNTNKCYEFSGNNKSLGCEDYSKPTDSILNYRVYDIEEKIFGHDCMILEFQGKYFWNRYYVSKNVKLNPDGYKDNKAYNWSFYGDKAKGGLILKMEHRFKNFIMKGIAINIENYTEDTRAIDIKKARSFCK